MRKILVAVMLAALIAISCSHQDAPGRVASDAAKEYYDMLATDNYEGFVSGMYFPDSIPGGYREQLVANAKMYVALQREEHKGIAGISVLNERKDSLSPTANVFLLLTYNDSTKEEIVVPMIENEDRWMMK